MFLGELSLCLEDLTGKLLKLPFWTIFIFIFILLMFIILSGGAAQVLSPNQPGVTLLSADLKDSPMQSLSQHSHLFI